MSEPFPTKPASPTRGEPATGVHCSRGALLASGAVSFLLYTAVIVLVVITVTRKQQQQPAAGPPATPAPTDGTNGGQPSAPPPTSTSTPALTRELTTLATTTLLHSTTTTTTAPPGTSTTFAATSTTTAAATTTRASPTATATTTTAGTTTTKAPTTTTTTRAPTTTTAAPSTAIAPPPATTAAPSNGSFPPAALGSRRGFCFRNSCTEPVWVGQIGAATGIPCAQGCPAGTICNTDNEVGCYFSLPFPSNKVKLLPGELFCLPFDFAPINTVVHTPQGDITLIVQWSGALYASTRCDGDMNCQTGVCKDCPSYRGPVGPVTQAELTLSPVWKDYYDTTIIHGANLPLVIKPLSVTGAFAADPNQKPAYHCAEPGRTTTRGDAPAASWLFDNGVTGTTGTKRSEPLVYGGSGAACSTSATCASGEACGISMGLTADNKPRSDVAAGVCGLPAGVWSRSELCGWTDADVFADCKSTVAGSPVAGTMQQLYKCAAPYDESCFQPSVTTNCCGCTTWDSFVPTHSEECKNHNALWDAVVRPHLETLKRACPTCYTYPYDDSTALSTCWDSETANTASYEFEWCPGGSKVVVV